MRSPNAVRRLVLVLMLFFACLMLAGMRPGSPESFRPNIPSAPSAQFTPFKGWSSLGHPQGISLAGPARGVNADGRQELFTIGSNLEVWHAWQLTPNGNWTEWLDFPGSVAYCVAVRSNADGRMELFALGQGSTVVHAWQGVPNGPFGGWQSFGAPQTSPTVVTSTCPIVPGQYADGRIDVFSVGTDGNVWSMGQQAPSDGWYSSWWSLGHPAGVNFYAGDFGSNSRLAWGMDACGSQHIFARGDDGAIYLDYDTNPIGDAWSGWIGLGHPVGVGLLDPAVGFNNDGRLELFAIGGDGNVWHMYQVAPCSSWTGWGVFGRPADLFPSWWNSSWYFQPVIGRYPTPAGYKMEVFVQAWSGDFWHVGQIAPSDGWGDWSNLGQPSVASSADYGHGQTTKGNNADGTLVFFARGDDGAIWMDPQGAAAYLPLITK